MDQELMKAKILMSQSRWAEAEHTLRESLAREPGSSEMMADLSLCLTQLNRGKDALRIARQAVGADPMSHNAFCALAFALKHENKLDDALSAIDEAISLDQESARGHYLRSSILLGKKQTKESLKSIDVALALEPDDADYLSYRSIILSEMNQGGAANSAAEAALRENPDNSDAHAAQGYAKLHTGQARESYAAFREALRLDPRNEFAREGLLEALRLHNPVYRPIFRWFMFMGQLSAKSRWGTIIGLYILYRIILKVGKSYPDLQWVTIPLVVLYVVFCFMSWIAQPLTNFFLLFHPLGRLALQTREKIRAAIFVGQLLTGLTLIVLGIAGNDSLFLSGIVLSVLTIPVSETLAQTGKRGKLLVGGFTLLLVLVGVASFFKVELLGVFALLTLVFMFTANAISEKE